MASIRFYRPTFRVAIRQLHVLLTHSPVSFACPSIDRLKLAGAGKFLLASGKQKSLTAQQCRPLWLFW